MCDVCNNESGGKDIGVAAVPGVPMSVMWCSNCLDRERIVIPTGAAEYFYVFIGLGNWDNLQDELREWWTWADGRYMKITEYCERFTREYIHAELDKYYATDTSNPSTLSSLPEEPDKEI